MFRAKALGLHNNRELHAVELHMMRNPQQLEAMSMSILLRLTGTVNPSGYHYPSMRSRPSTPPMLCCTRLTPSFEATQTVHQSHRRPFRYSTISSPPSLLSPYSRSTKVIGHSSTFSPIAFARTIISIWKV